MSKKCKFPELKAIIRQQEADSRGIRKLIHGSSGLERWQHWSDKRSHGNNTRCYLLTYAMLRGIPHYVSEAVFRSDDLWWISKGMETMSTQLGHPLSKEAIKEWFFAIAPDKEVAA
jgi:hypothetical protein